MPGREDQLDELEALVVSVISGVRALRRHGRWGWEPNVGRLQAGVAALARQLEGMKRDDGGAIRPSIRARQDDDWLPGPAH
jgi:hypothetical protein